MSNPVRAIPEGYHSVTPYLTCKSSAQAIDFYRSVFGAKEIMRMAGPDGKIGHAEIQIGDSRLMLVDRKSTRLNSSHGSISYAVFCLKKKKKTKKTITIYTKQ